MKIIGNGQAEYNDPKLVRPSGYPILIGYICIFITAYYWWLFRYSTDESQLVLGGDLFSILGAGIATICFGYAYHKSPGKERYYWLFLFLGHFSYVLGDAVWAYYDLWLQAEMPFPGWADVFYLLHPACILAAILVFMYLKKHIYSSFRLLLDILLTMTIMTTFSFNYIVSPLFTNTDYSGLGIAVSVAYPIADLSLIFGALSMYIGFRRTESKIYIPMILGLLLFTVTDTFYTYMTANNLYESGSLLDPLWIASLLVMGMSPLVYVKSLEDGMNPDVDSLVTNRVIPEANFPYIATALLTFLMFLMIGSIYDMKGLNVLVIGSSVAILLVLVRQMVTLLENQRLMSMLARSNEELVNLYAVSAKEARTDFLTGVYNRRGLEEALAILMKRAVRENAAISLLMIDIDYFKDINDEFGHKAGDAVLKQLADCIRQKLRDQEIVGRFGGEEFIVILPGIDEKRAELIAERLRVQISEQKYGPEPKAITITVSIGVAELTGLSKEDTQWAFKMVDSALYRAKNIGRNRVFVAS